MEKINTQNPFPQFKGHSMDDFVMACRAALTIQLHASMLWSGRFLGQPIIYLQGTANFVFEMILSLP